jgi:hypothetical protein
VEGEWDGGWYFGEEFCEGGGLVVYMHFEKWSLTEKIEMAKSRLGLGDEVRMSEDEKEVVRLREVGDEKARVGRWWEAVWWWKMARKVEARVDEDVRGREVPDGATAETKVWGCCGIAGVLLTVVG